MATTTIPWNDGSGDNIYLTYPSASGNQTVEVTSDANTGAARTKTVTFTSGVGSISRVLTIAQDSGVPPLPAENGRMWIIYNVTTTASATRLVYGNVSGLGSTMFVDGVEVATAATYQFATTGEHTVQFTANNGAIPANLFRSRDNVIGAYLPDTIRSMGNYVFHLCSACTFVVCRATTPPTGTNAMGTTMSFPIYVPYSQDHSIRDAYKTSWSNFSSRIRELNADGTIPT